MSVFLIAYDLNQETKRPPIVKAIKAFGDWAMLSESSYAVSTSDTSSQVYAKFERFLDDNDTLYVIALERPYFGQGPEDVNAWLERNLP